MRALREAQPRQLATAELASLDNPSVHSSFYYDVEEAWQMRAAFYTALGVPESEWPKKQPSYAPWLARARFERVKRSTIGLSEREQAVTLLGWKELEEHDMVTNLRERYHSEKSTIQYAMQNEKLYSKLFPNEPFEDVLQRGIEYRKKEGSLELVREEKELEGFLKIQRLLCDRNTPLGTRVIACSPPGLVANTIYTKRFVDIWELKRDAQGMRYAEMTRFTAGLDYEGYIRSVKKLDPSYFEGRDSSIPLDAWFLGQPLRVSLPADGEKVTTEKLYEEYFERDYAAMKEALFQELLIVCMPFIQYYIRELARDVVDWSSLAVTFNAVLNMADDFLKKKEHTMSWAPMESQSVHNYPYPSVEEVYYWGSQQVQTVAGGCGPSVGFGPSSLFRIRYGFEDPTEALVNSVGKFSVGGDIDDLGEREFPCPACNYTNKRPYNETIDLCENPGYCPDRTAVAC